MVHQPRNQYHRELSTSKKTHHRKSCGTKNTGLDPLNRLFVNFFMMIVMINVGVKQKGSRGILLMNPVRTRENQRESKHSLVLSDGHTKRM